MLPYLLGDALILFMGQTHNEGYLALAVLLFILITFTGFQIGLLWFVNTVETFILRGLLSTATPGESLVSIDIGSEDDIPPN